MNDGRSSSDDLRWKGEMWLNLKSGRIRYSKGKSRNIRHMVDYSIINTKIISFFSKFQKILDS